MGILTSLYSGIGLRFALLDENVAALYGLLGLLGTGMGFAGRHYFFKKRQFEAKYKKKLK